MPLAILGISDEYDQDIANAIYYAVDNGAKVTNNMLFHLVKSFLYMKRISN
jgi:hypothetical protein